MTRQRGYGIGCLRAADAGGRRMIRAQDPLPLSIKFAESHERGKVTPADSRCPARITPRLIPSRAITARIAYRVPRWGHRGCPTCWRRRPAGDRGGDGSTRDPHPVRSQALASRLAYDHVRGGDAPYQRAASKSRNGIERGSPNRHLGRLSFAWKPVRGLCYKDAWTTKSSTQRWPEASMSTHA